MGSGQRVHEPTGEGEAYVSTVEDVPEEVIQLMDTVELPAWVPRTPDSSKPTSSSRQLPVAPSSGRDLRTPDRVNIVADPEPEDQEEDDDSEEDSAPESGVPSDAEARPERRRRRRGRRGGRRNRGPDRGPSGGGGGGGEGGGPQGTS
jgi:hypothetical protein